MLRQLKRLADGARTYRRFGGLEESLWGVTRILLHKPNQRFRKYRWEQLKRREPELFADIGGVRFKLNPDDAGISAELALEGTHEPFSTKLLLEQVDRGMTVLDIGANLGYYAIQEAKRVGPEGKVIAIEPAPATFALLEENVNINQCDNVELIQGAVSDQRGEADLYVGAHANVSRLAERPDYIDKVTVPTYRIDDLVEKEERLDILRMDIEGHEVRAMEGMVETVLSKRPLICVELHFPLLSNDQIDAFIGKLTDADYRVGCFVFRFSEEIIFGRTLGRHSKVYKLGSASDLALHVHSENTVVFFHPAERPLRAPM